VPEFRAIVESDSPRSDAEALKAAGIELVGPWAVEGVRPGDLVADDREVSALVEESSAEEVADRVKAIVDPESRIEVIAVTGSEG
jgi:hypothetical protein